VRIVYSIAILLSLFLFTGSASAHPGRTDSSGGHTCRTNCESWGLDHGEYHSHGGYEAPEVEEQYVAPEQEEVEYVAPVQEEQYIAPIEETTDVSTPEIVESAAEPVVASESSGDISVAGLLGLAGLVGLGYAGWKKLNGKKKEKPPRV
jgi:hypothetical protein